MIPEYSGNLDFSYSVKPSKTYCIDFKAGKISGFIDGIEALKQAIYKIINTERFEYIIYSDNYGAELKNLFGKPKHFVYAELERCISEALLCDDRIENVYDFSFWGSRGSVNVRFSADTIFGKTEFESVVS